AGIFQIETARRTNQLQQILSRIAASAMSQFVAKSLDSKGVVDVCHGTKPPDPYMCWSGSIFDPKVGDIVRYVGPALLKMRGITVHSVCVKDRSNGRKDRSLQPCGGNSFGIQCRFHIHRRNRVKVVEPDVVFAAPDHLHRLTSFLRENSRFRDIIGLGLSAEASAEKCHVADDIFFRDTQLLRDDRLRSLRILRGRPRRDFAVLKFRSSYHWLHGSVRQKRNVILCLEELTSLCKLSVRVADIADNFPRLPRGCVKLVLVLIRVVGCVRSVVPLYLEFLSPLESSPSVVRDHRDSTQRLETRWRLERIDGNCLMNSCYFQRFTIIHRLDLSADNRGVFDRRLDHTVNAEIHAVLRLPSTKIGQVVALHPLPDVTPLAFCF